MSEAINFPQMSQQMLCTFDSYFADMPSLLRWSYMFLIQTQKLFQSLFWAWFRDLITLVKLPLEKTIHFLIILVFLILIVKKTKLYRQVHNLVFFNFALYTVSFSWVIITTFYWLNTFFFSVTTKRTSNLV